MSSPLDPLESTHPLPPEGGLLPALPSLELDSLDLGSFQAFLPLGSTERAPTLPPDRFQILQILGQGGQGIVAQVQDLILGRKVAVKWLRAGTPQEGEMLLREARSQASIEHPHICRIYETGVHEGRPYIVMQLVEGQPITRAVAGSNVSEQLQVLRMAAEAAHAAHTCGLIHRDLKPGNILVERTREGRPVPRLLDFGLATQVEELRRLQEQGLAAIAGTPAYMAPEQTRVGTTQVDQRTDVWALGVILYEMLTDNLPFLPSGGLDGLIDCHDRGVPDPQLVRPDLHPDLKAILLRALALRPDDRYPSAHAFAEDLTRFLDGKPVLARRAPLLERGFRWLRRHRGAAAGVFLGVLLFMVSMGIGLLNRSRGLAILTGALHFEERARDLELQLHRIRSLPAPQVGAAYATLRATVVQLESEAAGSHRWKQGPAFAALGRVYLALGQPFLARDRFESAREKGFFPPEVALGLGLALTEILDAKNREGLDAPPEERKRQLQHLRQTYAGPALSLLKEHRREAREPELFEARFLAAEGRISEGIHLLETQLRRTPWAFEHRRQLATLRVQQATEILVTDPGLEAKALEAIASGAALSPGDMLFPLLEARLHAAAFARGLRDNALFLPRRDSAEAALQRVLDMDPTQEEANEARVRLCFIEANILANRLEDNSAAWGEGVRRCHAALQRTPQALWARHQLLRFHAAQAYTLLDLDNAAAQKHAEEALPHHLPLRSTPYARQAAGDAALAHFVLARRLFAQQKDALPSCETALGLLDQGEHSMPNQLLRSELLVLRGQLRPDGRADYAQGIEVLAQIAQATPGNPVSRMNLAILTGDAAAHEAELWGIDPRPRLAQARELLAQALEGSLDLAPRVAGLRLLMDQTEASYLLELGGDATGLRARMRQSLPLVPRSVRPWTQASLDQVELGVALTQGRDPAPFVAALRKNPALAEQKSTLAEGSLLLAFHSHLQGRSQLARKHLHEWFSGWPALSQSANQFTRHQALRMSLDAALLESALDASTAAACAQRARAAADLLQRHWPGTPAAEWGVAVAAHLSGRSQDWEALTRRWPQLRKSALRMERLLSDRKVYPSSFHPTSRR